MRWEEFAVACPEIASRAEDRFRTDQLVMLATLTIRSSRGSSGLRRSRTITSSLDVLEAAYFSFPDKFVLSWREGAGLRRPTFPVVE